MNTFVRHHRKVVRSGVFQVAKKYSAYCTTHHRSYSLYIRNAEGTTFTASALTRGNSLLPQHSAAVPLSYFCVKRNIHSSYRLYDTPSSKVEVTVQEMKKKQKEKVEEIIKEAVGDSNALKTSSAATQAPLAASTGKVAETAKAVDKPITSKPVVAKKSLQARIWEEIVHYYHGFRLLFIDINICRKLLWRVLNGKTLTRRENKLLLRTTSDLFRLIPFSVFIIVPFMELLLPIFIKFFPGMLPSTFQTAKERDEKLKQSLQVRLEMAKFLQKTLDEMAVQHKDHESTEATSFSEFFKKIKNPNEYVGNDDIIKFAKRFEDEVTLDSLSRDQLSALCRVLELNTMGTTNMLRFHLRLRLRSLAADDRVIAREGVNALDLFELQQACKARGMRAYGLTPEIMRSQLQEWIDLSLNERVPPTLLLLSRALLIPDGTTTTHKLKETIRTLPDSIAAKTKDAIAESEGKIDNKAKIEIIKEEERKIKEEREEEREEQKAKVAEEKAKAEILLDKAPVFTSAAEPMPMNCPPKPIDLTPEIKRAGDQITPNDVTLLTEALMTLSGKKEMAVEKEIIKEIKEELQDYKDDVEELREVRNVVKEPVRESRAAKQLFKKVNTMISNLDKVLDDLEKKHNQMQKSCKPITDITMEEAGLKFKDEEILRIDELMHTIRKLKQTSDDARLKQIEVVLSKIDSDNDGVITIDEVLHVIEAVGRDNVNMSEKQIEELITLLGKEHSIETEEKIEKALAKSAKEARKQEEENKKAAAEKATNIDAELKDAAMELKDTAPVVKDTTIDMNLSDTKNNMKTETKMTKSENSLLEAAEKQTETIIPKTDITATMPPTLPPTAQVNPKDKML